MVKCWIYVASVSSNHSTSHFTSPHIQLQLPGHLGAFLCSNLSCFDCERPANRPPSFQFTTIFSRSVRSLATEQATRIFASACAYIRVALSVYSCEMARMEANIHFYIRKYICHTCFSRVVTYCHIILYRISM